MRPKRLWPLCVLSPNYHRSTTFQVRSEPSAGVQLCNNLQSLAAVYDVQPDNLTAMLVAGMLVAEPPGAPVR